MEDLWNKWGERDAAIEANKTATPEQIANQKIIDDLIRAEIDAEIIAKIKQIAAEDK